MFDSHLFNYEILFPKDHISFYYLLTPLLFLATQVNFINNLLYKIDLGPISWRDIGNFFLNIILGIMFMIFGTVLIVVGVFCFVYVVEHFKIVEIVLKVVGSILACIMLIGFSYGMGSDFRRSLMKE